MSRRTAREIMAEAQASLVRALARGAPVPAGFDTERVREAAVALVSKRRRWVERAWPGLAAALGESFRSRFESWARQNPMGLEANPLADGRRFAEALLAAGEFPDPAREELLVFELRYRLTGEGLVRRRGLTLKTMRTGSSRLLAARLPGGRILRLRLPG
jgi:ribosomal protein L34E